MANEIKIIRLDDRTLEAIKNLEAALVRFSNQITPFISILSNPSFVIAEFEGELTAVIDGEEYVSNV